MGLIYFGLMILFFLILLFASLGFGELLHDQTALIKKFKAYKNNCENISLNFERLVAKGVYQLTLSDLGNRRIEEVSESITEKHEAQKVVWKFAVVLWYKEQSLKHLYGDLRKVSSLFCALLFLGGMYVLLDQWDNINDIKSYSDHLLKAGGHVIPILELFSFILILLRIFAERDNIKNLIENH
jgi:hypothetical protein